MGFHAYSSRIVLARIVLARIVLARIVLAKIFLRLLIGGVIIEGKILLEATIEGRIVILKCSFFSNLKSASSNDRVLRERGA